MFPEKKRRSLSHLGHGASLRAEHEHTSWAGWAEGAVWAACCRGQSKDRITKLQPACCVAGGIPRQDVHDSHSCLLWCFRVPPTSVCRLQEFMGRNSLKLGKQCCIWAGWVKKFLSSFTYPSGCRPYQLELRNRGFAQNRVTSTTWRADAEILKEWFIQVLRLISNLHEPIGRKVCASSPEDLSEAKGSFQKV